MIIIIICYFYRAWVSINNCFVLSKEYPGIEKKKTNIHFEKSLTELQTHIDRLKAIYGSFTYAPPQTPLSKTKPFKFVSIINGISISFFGLENYPFEMFTLERETNWMNDLIIIIQNLLDMTISFFLVRFHSTCLCHNGNEQ